MVFIPNFMKSLPLAKNLFVEKKHEKIKKLGSNEVQCDGPS
jgi:hypothetical protein